MHLFPRRPLAVAAAAALACLVVGGAWSFVRVGWSRAQGAARLETHVRGLIDERARQVRALAEVVSTEGALVERASADRPALTDLFTRLSTLAGPEADPRVSVTVYVPSGPKGRYRVLAWSDGPAEDVGPDRLSGPPALFVAQGPSGLRLVFSQPIEMAGRRVGVAAAETILSPAGSVGSTEYHLDTASGSVVLTPVLFAGTGVPDASTSFVVAAPGGPPLLEVRYSPLDLANRQRTFVRRIAGAALAPFVVAALLFIGPLLARRAAVGTARPFLRWSAITSAALVAGAAALWGLAVLTAMPAEARDVLLALAALGLASLGPVSIWWRYGHRLQPGDRPLRFAVDLILGGVLAASMLAAATWVLRARINETSLTRWEFPFFPIDAPGLSFLTSLLLIEAALFWTMAAGLAALAARWRLSWRRPASALLAAAVSIAGAVAGFACLARRIPVSPAAWAIAAAVAIAFALVSTSLRRYYRRTTQAMRLVLIFTALFAPTAALYPTAAFDADQTTRQLIAQAYAPATAAANRPEQLRAIVTRAEEEIDRIAGLDALVASAALSPLSTQTAFKVWSQTSLSRSRITSDVELFGPRGMLASRFALNIPEYVNAANTQTWAGGDCAWHTYVEARRLGAEDRMSIHAERGLCDAAGHLLGAVAVHVVPDYRALPFVSSASPVADVLPVSEATTRESRITDLEVVVYGWSLYPTFKSGRVAWPIDNALFTQLNASRAPFWTTLPAAGRPYRVYVASDRSGIYALGYPTTSPFEHATRLAEAAVLTAMIFVVLLIGAALFAPFAARRDAPLRVLFNEVRTSFYRKLFLFFVLAAVGPVVVLALAFGAYMTSKFRADVESEAADVVTVARRVLEELAAAEQRPNQGKTPPSDDVMVWIGQVIGQDVHLFHGSQLAATSQRDLFDSGLLPTRTPAAVYRAIALDRLVTFVGPDRLGSLQYLVAAAPVPAEDRDGVLTVPLAPRQREIEREMDELDPGGVLVGAVLVVLFAAGLGASVAGRISDPVARLTRATRQIAAGRPDVRIVADTADELRRLVDDFNSMAATLDAQRTALARTNQLKAWNEMARQVAHEIKNPLTPIQLSTEHMQRVHEDQGRPLGAVFDQCVTTILRQVRLLRQIASEFSNFSSERTPRLTAVDVYDLVQEVVAPYLVGLRPAQRIVVDVPAVLPALLADRTLLARALTNLVENALQAMPDGGTLTLDAAVVGDAVAISLADTGVGMDDEAARHAFEPYFSTKTAGSGLGLANAKRNIELCGGTIALESAPGVGTTVMVRVPMAGPAASATA